MKLPVRHDIISGLEKHTLKLKKIFWWVNLKSLKIDLTKYDNETKLEGIHLLHKLLMVCTRITIKLNPVWARCPFQDRLFFFSSCFIYVSSIPVGATLSCFLKTRKLNLSVVTTQDSAIWIMHVAGTFDYSYSNQHTCTGVLQSSCYYY